MVVSEEAVTTTKSPKAKKTVATCSQKMGQLGAVWSEKLARPVGALILISGFGVVLLRIVYASLETGHFKCHVYSDQEGDSATVQAWRIAMLQTGILAFTITSSDCQVLHQRMATLIQ